MNKYVLKTASLTLASALIVNSVGLANFEASAAKKETIKTSKSSEGKLSKNKLVSKKTGKTIKGYVLYKGKVYKNGVLFAGTVNGLRYSKGKKATATIKGIKYVAGKKVNASISGTLYVNGLKYSGTKNGVKYVKGKKASGVIAGVFYKLGKKATGTFEKTYYYKGKVASGVINGTLYKAGKKASGTVSGVYYYKGTIATDVVNGIFYKKGKKATGVAKNGKLYVAGKPNKGAYYFGEKWYTDTTVDTAKNTAITSYLAAKDLNEKDYTATSWAVFATVLKTNELAVKDASVTTVQFVAATAAIKDAAAKLVLTTTENPSTGGGVAAVEAAKEAAGNVAAEIGKTNVTGQAIAQVLENNASALGLTLPTGFANSPLGAAAAKALQDNNTKTTPADIKAIVDAVVELDSVSNNGVPLVSAAEILDKTAAENAARALVKDPTKYTFTATPFTSTKKLKTSSTVNDWNVAITLIGYNDIGIQVNLITRLLGEATKDYFDKVDVTEAAGRVTVTYREFLEATKAPLGERWYSDAKIEVKVGEQTVTKYLSEALGNQRGFAKGQTGTNSYAIKDIMNGLNIIGLTDGMYNVKVTPVLVNTASGVAVTNTSKVLTGTAISFDYTVDRTAPTITSATATVDSLPVSAVMGQNGEINFNLATGSVTTAITVELDEKIKALPEGTKVYVKTTSSSTYTEYGTIVLNNDEKTLTITPNSTNHGTVGTENATFVLATKVPLSEDLVSEVTDEEGNRLMIPAITVTVKDTVAPTITTVATDKELTVDEIKAFVLEAATATDNVDASIDVTTEIKIGDIVGGIADVKNLAVGGAFTVTYKAVDIAGNKATKTVTYTVIANPDTVEPKVTGATYFVGTEEKTATITNDKIKFEVEKGSKTSEIRFTLSEDVKVPENAKIIVKNGNTVLDADYGTIKVTGNVITIEPKNGEAPVAGTFTIEVELPEGESIKDLAGNNLVIPTIELVVVYSEAQAQAILVEALAAGVALPKFDTGKTAVENLASVQVVTNGGLTTGSHFLVNGLLIPNKTGQKASTLSEVADYLNTKYGTVLNTGNLSVADGKISITGALVSQEDFVKLKLNVDEDKKQEAYRITVLNGSDKKKKLVKIAILPSGNAVIEDIAEANKQAAATVTALITALLTIDQITLANAEAIRTAHSAFYALTTDQKSFVTADNITAINAAFKKIVELEMKAVEDKVAADRVTALITGLPAVDKITLEQAGAIKIVNTDFNALTEDQKALVSSESKTKLDALLDIINELEKEAAELAAQAILDEALAAGVALPKFDTGKTAVENLASVQVVTKEGLTADSRFLVHGLMTTDNKAQKASNLAEVATYLTTINGGTVLNTGNLSVAAGKISIKGALVSKEGFTNLKANVTGEMATKAYRITVLNGADKKKKLVKIAILPSGNAVIEDIEEANQQAAAAKLVTVTQADLNFTVSYAEGYKNVDASIYADALVTLNTGKILPTADVAFTFVSKTSSGKDVTVVHTLTNDNLVTLFTGKSQVKLSDIVAAATSTVGNTTLEPAQKVASPLNTQINAAWTISGVTADVFKVEAMVYKK